MILTCPNCAQKNRVGAPNLTRQVRCGSCKSDIAPVVAPIEADLETFEEIATTSGVPVLVDFWAAWCGPCLRAAPEVKKTAAAVSGRALVLKVDTERHPEIAARYHVAGIPNFVVLSNGHVVAQHAGLVDHREMTRWITVALETGAT
jgi:thioredoxin 2